SVGDQARRTAVQALLHIFRKTGHSMTNGYDLACPGYRTALRALGAPTLNGYGLTLLELVTSSVPHNAEGTEMECSRIATTLESLRRLSRQILGMSRSPMPLRWRSQIRNPQLPLRKAPEH